MTSVPLPTSDQSPPSTRFPQPLALTAADELPRALANDELSARRRTADGRTPSGAAKESTFEQPGCGRLPVSRPCGSTLVYSDLHRVRGSRPASVRFSVLSSRHGSGHRDGWTSDALRTSASRARAPHERRRARAPRLPAANARTRRPAAAAARSAPGVPCGCGPPRQPSRGRQHRTRPLAESAAAPASAIGSDQPRPAHPTEGGIRARRKRRLARA